MAAFAHIRLENQFPGFFIFKGKSQERKGGNKGEEEVLTDA